MSELLYGIVGVITRLHNYFLTLNDQFETRFTDKTLHFLIIGALGMLLVLAIHPLFTWLAKNDHTIAITFLYVFTVILVIVFAIEIGQGVSGSGNMDFADIMYGVVGFLAFFLLFAIARAIYKLVRGMLK